MCRYYLKLAVVNREPHTAAARASQRERAVQEGQVTGELGGIKLEQILTQNHAFRKLLQPTLEPCQSWTLSEGARQRIRKKSTETRFIFLFLPGYSC